MHKMQCLHETIIRDIIDFTQDIKDSDEIQRVSNYKNKNSWKSITSKSEALTLVFPTLASKNLSYEAAAMISKANERNAAIMLNMLFSAANITTATDGIDYLSKFHTNLDTSKLTVDGFMDAMDNFVEENALLIKESAQYEEYNKIKKDLLNTNFYFENDIDDDSVNNYKIINLEGTQILVHEAPNNTKDQLKDYTQITKDMASISKSEFDIQRQKLLDGDIKKSNELSPTMMYVNFVSMGSDSKYPIQSSMIIGIKSKLYAIDSQDIINRLKIKNNDKNLTLNLIKAGTREISFLKDFIFAIDKAKIDALSQSKRGSSNKIWKVLERRALKSKLRRSMFMTNDASAISTLVISQEEVEYLKKTEFIDVENPAVIRPILDAYNLMRFVIIDEALEIAKFISDTGDDMYEVITFNNMERETKDNSKKIINLMSKISR